MTGRPSSYTEEIAAEICERRGVVEIYGLFDPTEGNLRYVGKARKSASRLKGHLRDARHRKTPVYLWIAGLLDRGLRPLMAVLRVVDDASWKHAEREEIVSALAHGCDLLNLAPGGNEPFCSQETRAANGKRVAILRVNDPLKRRIYELKRNLMQAAKRGYMREETKAKLRELAARQPERFACFSSL